MKLTILDQDGVITKKIIFNYPNPANELESNANLLKIRSESKLTNFAKYRLRFLRGKKIVITGRKRSVLGNQTEQEIIKLFGKIIPIRFYDETATYNQQEYFDFKLREITNAIIGFSEVDIYDDDLGVCLYLYQVAHFGEKKVRIFYVPDATKLKRILITEKILDEEEKRFHEERYPDQEYYSEEYIARMEIEEFPDNLREYLKNPSEDIQKILSAALCEAHLESDEADSDELAAPFEQEDIVAIFNKYFEEFFSLLIKEMPLAKKYPKETYEVYERTLLEDYHGDPLFDAPDEPSYT